MAEKFDRELERPVTSIDGPLNKFPPSSKSSPPPAVQVLQRVPKSFFTQGKLFAPKFIPKQIAQALGIKDQRFQNFMTAE
ncbi:MAG: hypothetical protein DMG36_22680 [Acidobacteria bacterium]|nr:MAG: hypothetical protein DMG36_22680 [Acidobacteriota bacterium]